MLRSCRAGRRRGGNQPEPSGKTGLPKSIEELFDIPDYQIESLARVLLPQIKEYLLSEQGQKDYAEWTAEHAQRQLNIKD